MCVCLVFGWMEEGFVSMAPVLIKEWGGVGIIKQQKQARCWPSKHVGKLVRGIRGKGGGFDTHQVSSGVQKRAGGDGGAKGNREAS